MPPKKNQRHNQKQKRTTPTISSSSTSSSAPKLQISAQNESRLRRLLLNSAPSASSLPPVEHTLSKPHQAKKLTSLYEKLSCEGFTNHQIELALTALKGSATFEVVLDWLCLNLASNEIPMKFSSGISTEATEGGSVGVLVTSREDSIGLVDRTSMVEEEEPEFSVKIKQFSDDTTLDAHQPSQADWIKQYVRQQEEADYTRWEDEAVNYGSCEEAHLQRTHDVIVNEYRVARFEATQAKLKGDKKSQEKAEITIRNLKQEILAFGISDDVLTSEFRYEKTSECLSENTSANSVPSVCFEVERLSDIAGNWAAEECLTDDNKLECFNSEDFPVNPIPMAVPVPEEKSSDEQEVELGDLFDEDAPEILHDSMKLQRKERMKDLISEKNLDKLAGIWKKGDPRKIPKAVLHQLCQKSGWEAPKFSKVDKKENSFSYAVSVLRKASGRGKSRKPGGLTILKLRPEEEAFESAEDSQNRVAAFALSQLFPDFPLHVLLTEPYASLLLQWKEGEPAGSAEESEEARRAGFVDSLLDSSNANANATDESTDSSLCGKIHPSCYKETDTLGISAVDRVTARQNSSKVDESSSYLKMELENKMTLPKYQDILKARASLPVAELKGDIINLLKENNVLVVSGETGSGKTTQVPQFILDDMIKSGRGGYCNIICTQPRRIAAISVAERVAEERCEPSVGADGSLVGYQVRLESARNESTKLLFCTTGVLLRKISGDRNLTGVTHVIVDEVHERSILSDFLLTILKNLVEKNSTRGSSDLKVILMSATVDSNLFSRYFWDCPVIVAQGRSHLVTTYYLEDIYESIDYRLASDSPASLRYQTSTVKKIAPINNHRGKKNLSLSSWGGDDYQLSEDCINPNYIAESYHEYSEQTQETLKRLNEDVIDYDLLEDLVCYIDETCDKGAILVFLPGVTEIHMLHDKLTASFRFGGQASDWILPLHSAVSSSDQKKVFLQPPEDIRKVIIATNIAETSITINDVVYVIDCGKHKENRYNPVKKLSSMVEDWISQANSRQRQGRAGRVKPGTCFCLFTRHRFVKLMRPYQVPEMLRMPLVELCLQIKLLSLGQINPFLSQALEPPKEEAIASAVSLLYEVGALEGNEELTPLGHHLARIPVDVLIGKMMLYGAIFGCLSPILSISAFLSYKSPFIYPKDESQNIERAKLTLLTDNPNGSSDSHFSYNQSDHLLMMIAYIKWEKILREKGPKAASKFCSSYFLNSSVMYMTRDMRIQFGTLLADIGFIELPKTYQINKTKKELLDSWLSDASRPFNLYSQHSSIIKAILCAGLYPNVAASGRGITEASLSGLMHSFDLTTRDLVWYDGRRRVHVHPSSINSHVKAFQYPFLVFLEKVETNKVFVRDTTVVSPYSILLFGGSINIQHQTGSVVIDGWLKLRAPAQTAVLFKELRLTLHSILKMLISKPEAAIVMNNEIVRSIVHLLSEEDKPPA